MPDGGWIDLDGAVNVRDLGGLPTSDGSRTRAHVLIRSDNLQSLSPADVRHLVDDVRVRTVADLRTDMEVRGEGPGPISGEPAVEVRNLGLFPETAATDDAASDVLPWQERSERMTPDERVRGAAGTYLRYLSDRPDSVLAALRLIAGTDGATIVHCAAGKDRTGVIVAMALSEVGVPDAEIVADYTRSAERIEAIIAALAARSTYNASYLKDANDGGADFDIDRHTPKADTMQGFLDALVDTAGGASEWLRAHGWTDADAHTLRQRLVE